VTASTVLASTGKKDLFGVVEELLLVGSQQSVGEPIDGAAPRLEPLAADVETEDSKDPQTLGTRTFPGSSKLKNEIFKE